MALAAFEVAVFCVVMLRGRQQARIGHGRERRGNLDHRNFTRKDAVTFRTFEYMVCAVMLQGCMSGGCHKTEGWA